jgi:hypothetical protein
VILPRVARADPLAIAGASAQRREASTIAARERPAPIIRRSSRVRPRLRPLRHRRAQQSPPVGLSPRADPARGRRGANAQELSVPRHSGTRLRRSPPAQARIDHAAKFTSAAATLAPRGPAWRCVRISRSALPRTRSSRKPARERWRDERSSPPRRVGETRCTLDFPWLVSAVSSFVPV